MGIENHVDIFLRGSDVVKEGLKLYRLDGKTVIIKFDIKTTVFFDDVDQARQVLEKIVSDFNELVSIKIDLETKEGGLPNEKDT